MASNERIEKVIEEIRQEILEIEKSCASFSLIEADEIKEKAIDILKKAIEKIEKVETSIKDQNEINKVLSYVRNKSKILTRETIDSIEYIRKTESIKDKTNYGQEENQKEKTKVKKIVIKKINKENDDITRQSIVALKEWFK